MQENKTTKKYFMLKLNPIRSTFHSDMTEEEKGIMKQHGDYWRKFADDGIALIFGPVLDPRGAYGAGIIEIDNEEQIQSFTSNDPAIKEGLGVYEVFPILAVLSKRWSK